MLDPQRQERLVNDLRARGVETIALSRAAFEKVAYREGPDGFLAVLPALGSPLDALDVPADAFVLVAEGIEKPGNLGSMLRSAESLTLMPWMDVAPKWSRAMMNSSTSTSPSAVMRDASTLDRITLTVAFG